MSQEKWNGLPTALLPALLPPPSPGRDSNSDPPRWNPRARRLEAGGGL